LLIEGLDEGQAANFQLSSMDVKVVPERQITRAMEEIDVAKLKKGAYLYTC